MLKNKNSPLKKSKQYDIDPEAIKQRKIEAEKSIEEKLNEVMITKTEEKELTRVFKLLAQNKSYFSLNDIDRVLKLLDLKLTKQEMQLMIWEVDERLDQKVRYNELLNMYKKCIMDKIGLEPKSLFHMIQFLMYCKTDKYTVTVEDSLELIYVRTGKVNFESEIEAIFGKEEKIVDGKEKEMTFKEYLEKINKRVIQQRKDRAKEIQEKYKNSPIIKLKEQE